MGASRRMRGMRGNFWNTNLANFAKKFFWGLTQNARNARKFLNTNLANGANFLPHKIFCDEKYTKIVDLGIFCYICTRNRKCYITHEMKIVFDKEYLSELYYEGKTRDKTHRYQPQVIRRYKYCVDVLESARRIEDLFCLNSLHYEILKGDKKGVSSIRVNKQYRVEFTVTTYMSETVINVCNILELSNHYN